MNVMLSEHLPLLSTAPDGIQKLRALILELAVRGKLIPQDPNDDPASTLIEQISQGQTQCEDGRKISKLLPPIDTNEKIFRIPETWQWVRLGDIGTTNIGLTYSPNDISNDGIPVLRSGNIQNGLLDLSDLVRVKLNVRESALVKEGDLLICARNGSKALVGKTALISGLTEKTAFGAFMAIYRSPINFYLLYFINSPLFKKLISDVNTTTINQITQNNLKSTVLPLPPLAEQQRIVAKVDELMALCDRLEAEQTDAESAHTKLVDILLGTLTQSTGAADFATNWQRIAEHFDTFFTTESSLGALKKTILQLAVMGKLVPQNRNDEPAKNLLQQIAQEQERLDTKRKRTKLKPTPVVEKGERPFQIPESWEWVRLGTIARNVQYGYTASANHSLNGVRFLRITDIQEDLVNWSSVPGCDIPQSDIESYRLVDGDIVIARTGGTIGKSYLVDGLNCTAIFASYLIRIGVLPGTNPRYTKVFLGSPSYWSQLYAHSMGTGQPNVNGTALSGLIVPLPPLAEQYRIVDKVEELMTLCNQLKDNLAESLCRQEQFASTLIESSLKAA